jgi:hypothetical protein
MAVGGWTIVDKFRRQEATIGAILAVLVALATMALTYLSY